MPEKKYKLKSYDYILLALVAVLSVLGILSYFFIPKDPETVKVVIQSFITAIGMILSFKFGVHQVQPTKVADTQGEQK